MTVASNNRNPQSKTLAPHASAGVRNQKSEIHIFGIRHHGPGSARSVRHALEALQPDALLVEGPPDAEDVLPLLAHSAMQPPVALLIYEAEPPKAEGKQRPRKSVFYPFAVFSPEWQALHFGLTRNIPVHFMDLPQAHQLALPEPDDRRPTTTDEQSDSQSTIRNPKSEIRNDPLKWLAEAAGYSDGERWWEHIVEQRRDSLTATSSADLFAAILEAMTALRTEADTQTPPDFGELSRAAHMEQLREAHMRQTIRAAQRHGFKRIAVVCGAWHAPALADMSSAQVGPERSERADADLLKGLPRLKVQTTWTPWTYGRLSWASGYGAGIGSPGWYHHLWQTGQAGLTPTQVAIAWMTRVARLLRDQDLDASSASVIEAVRLAEALAALRGHPLPGLDELTEATLTVLCFGDSTPLRLIHDQLIVSETLGHVPDDAPSPPLAQDVAREQKRLRLLPEAAQRTLDLDLRKPNDLDRSHLLHRLDLLGVPWGKAERVTGKSGTFHEVWRLQWQPEFAVALIEASVWGNSVHDAATAHVRDAANRAPDLPALTNLLDHAMLADLPDAVAHLMDRLQAQAALASDVSHLMDALPSLANILRYGNVRQTDASMVSHVVDGLVARVCIGLPGACASLNDEAAAAMHDRVIATNGAIALLQNDEHVAAWQAVLRQMADMSSLHGLVAGRCCRLLLDAGIFTSDEASRRMSLALSTAVEPPQAAAWVEGFLKGSGLLLLHDEALWQVLDNWVTALAGETFTALLPLLRRTFSTFAAPERRQMGERVKHGVSHPAVRATASTAFDIAHAEAVLPLVMQLLGIPPNSAKLNGG